MKNVVLIGRLVLCAATVPVAITIGSQLDLLRVANADTTAAVSRNWTFTDTDVKGNKSTSQFDATYLRTNGFDSPIGQAYVVLKLKDGRTKAYPIRNFSAADKGYIEAQPKQVYTPDPAQYTPKYTDYDPAKDSATVNFYETQHFVFYWGKQTTADAREWDNPAFRELNFKYFEDTWNFNAQVIKAPMPYEDQAQKFKLNVYISCTGLPKHPDGFAYGGENILMHPGALKEGSSVVPHEFTHVIQFYSGGFRDNPDVGWFWENHANWNCFQYYPSYPAAIGVYAERMHYELNSSRMNYGSWPFLQYMAEDTKFGTAFCFDIWKHNKRNANGASLETPFQTIMRLGVEQGKFKGDGVEDFGDVIGNVAAHNVTWDYINQYSITTDLDKFYNSLNRPTSDRVTLHPVPDKPNTFEPLYSQAPRQYGINIIDLTPNANAKSVTVNFNGIADEVEGSDWRVTLVAIDEKGTPRYSPMWRTGSQTFELRPNEKQVALAIAATPSIYRIQEFRPGFNGKARHSYEVSFEGAKPTALLAKPTRPNLRGTAHPNGGGFVEANAVVAPTAYVGPNAQVLGNAKVLDNARIEDSAVVRDAAVISGEAIICGDAIVSGRAQITEQSRVRDNATVADQAVLKGNARVLEYARIQGNGSIGGNALIKGFGEVHTSPNAPIGGGTIMGEDLEVHTGGRSEPINFGLIYGFTDANIMKTDLKDNRYLYAHWDFNEARKNILLDTNADNNGVLRGKTLPSYTDGALNFDGTDQYALVGGSVVDTADMTITMRLNWAGGSNQKVFSFGDEDANLYFTPQDANGKPAFIINKDGIVQTLASTVALPTNKATRVSIVLQGDTGRLYIDGRPVGTSDKMTFNPEDMRAKWGTIGAGEKGTSPFKGSIDDIAVYRTGVMAPMGQMTPAQNG